MDINSPWHEEFKQEAASRRWIRPLHPDATRQQAGALPSPQTAESLDADWSEEEVVRLHWQLLERLKLLQDTRTPLEEKIDVLQWIFTDAQHDQLPFSFVNCVRVVGLSPLSPLPSFIGAVDPEDIRDWVRCRIRRWFEQSLDAFPAWVREAIVAEPAWIARQLERNPQWLNEQIRRTRVEGDLFS